MEQCLGDIINDPQALKDFLRSSSQTDNTIEETDVTSTSLDEALSSSLDFLASITASSSLAGSDFGENINQTLQTTPALGNLQYNQIPMGIDYVLNSELGSNLNTVNGKNTQSSALPSATFVSSYPNSLPQTVQNVGYNSSQSVSISRPGVKQSVPLILSNVKPNAAGHGNLTKRSNSPKKRAAQTASQSNVFSAGTSKGIPTNVEQLIQQPETSLTNVFPNNQQTVLNNGMMTANGQAILVPSAGGKMLIVNSPSKGNQAIALPADFLQQQQQSTFISGINQNATMGTKQLFVLPSQLQNQDLSKQTQVVGIASQGVTSLNASPSVQQLNVNYPVANQGNNGNLQNLSAKSDGQPSLVQGSVSNTGLQNVNLIVSSQPREILPKRVGPIASLSQHPNILPKVTISQADNTANLFGNTGNVSTQKQRVQLYTTNPTQVINQQITNQQYTSGNVQFQQVTPNQLFPATTPSTVGQSTLSILQASVRNVASPPQPSKQVSTNQEPVPTASHQIPINKGLSNNVSMVNSNLLATNSKGQVGPAQKIIGRQSTSFKRGQSPVKNQQNIIFKQGQNAGSSPVATPTVTATQRNTLPGSYQPSSVLQQGQITTSTLPATAATISSLSQTSFIPGTNLQSQLTQLSAGSATHQQSTSQPQYSLLGKEGIQKLIQLYQQQGQATGQKLTSLGSLGAANLTALMQKLMYLQQQQQQQQQTGSQLQPNQTSPLASQQLLQGAGTPVQVLTQHQPGSSTVAQDNTLSILSSQVASTTSIQNQGQNPTVNSAVRFNPSLSVPTMTNTDLNSLSSLLASSAGNQPSTTNVFTDNPGQSVAVKTQTGRPQNVQLVTSSSVVRPGDNKPLLVQLPQDKGTGVTSFISAAQLTQSQLQDLQQKLLVQKINQQAQHLLPKQLASVGQSTQAVNVSASSKAGTSGVKTNVVYIKPTTKQQKQVTNVSFPGTLPVAANKGVPSTISTSKIVIKPIFSTPSSLTVSGAQANKVVASSAVQTKFATKTPSSVGELQISPQGQQKIVISKKIKDQLQSLSSAQKEQLLRNPKQVLVINGQKVPLAQLLQQLAEESKAQPKAGKATVKRPLTLKETEEKIIEETESKVTKRLKHCLAADQARVLKPERDKPFRSAEDALSKLIPYHVFFEETPTKHVFEKDEMVLDSVAEQLLEKKQQLIRRFDTLLLNEFQRSVPTAEVVMLNRLFVTDERSLLQKDKQDAKEGKFQLHIFDQDEEEEEEEEEEDDDTDSEDDVSVSDNLLCGEEMEDGNIDSDVEIEPDDLDPLETSHAIPETNKKIRIGHELGISVPNISVDADMTEELNEATSNLLADLESDDMFSL